MRTMDAEKVFCVTNENLSLGRIQISKGIVLHISWMVYKSNIMYKSLEGLKVVDRLSWQIHRKVSHRRKCKSYGLEADYIVFMEKTNNKVCWMTMLMEEGIDSAIRRMRP